MKKTIRSLSTVLFVLMLSSPSYAITVVRDEVSGANHEWTYEAGDADLSAYASGAISSVTVDADSGEWGDCRAVTNLYTYISVVDYDPYTDNVYLMYDCEGTSRVYGTNDDSTDVIDGRVYSTTSASIYDPDSNLLCAASTIIDEDPQTVNGYLYDDDSDPGSDGWISYPYDSGEEILTVETTLSLSQLDVDSAQNTVRAYSHSSTSADVSIMEGGA